MLAEELGLEPGAPGLRVLATSREPLGVAGETMFTVRPLTVPADPDDAAGIAGSPAVRLFADRAAARAGRDVAGAAVGTVGRICRALDGLPLAIELAAARASALSVAEIEQHLADKFRFLAYQRPVAGARHQALKAAIGWSYELLPGAERSFLRQLSVFAGGARMQHASTYLGLAEREHRLAVLSAEHDNFRAALDWSLVQGDETGLRLAAALGGFWRARGLFQDGRGWLERATAIVPSGGRLRADLLRLLAMMLQAGGDLERASAILAEAMRAAEAASLPAMAARIAVLQTDIGALTTGPTPKAIAECEAAVPTLEAAGDLAGLAEAWTVLGKMRLFSGSGPPGDEEALERAIDYAQRSGSEGAEREAIIYLLLIFNRLRIPVDVALSRAEHTLAALPSDPWDEAAVRIAVAPLYAYAGRFAEARAAIARGRTLWAQSGATFYWAIWAPVAGWTEMIAGDAAAAERELRGGYEALRDMGDQGFLASTAAVLAEAVYEQGRLAEAQQLADEAREAAVTGDLEAHAQWRAISAKLLARGGRFAAARKLASEAVALIPASAWDSRRAEMLVAKAEVLRLAGPQIRTVVVGGMPGWQIALIAAGTAVLAAILAVAADRARAARRHAPALSL